MNCTYRVRSTAAPLWLAVACLVLCTTLVPSLGRAQLSVGNQFVTAKVYGNDGLVRVATTPGGFYDKDGKGERFLTFPFTSYLTVMINGLLYTNNDPSNFDFSSLKNFGGYLEYGNSNIIGDTIRTEWALTSGTLVQEIYPVAFDLSGQIVFRWKFKNLFNTAVPVQCQYLLDTKIVQNDRAKVLTRFGYRRFWSGYIENNDNYKPIPPFYQAFQNDIDSANSYDPGVVSQGTFISPELGLMKPDAVQIGDWYNNLSGTPWGWQTPMPQTEYYDSGVLMIFPPKVSGGRDSVEIGRTAYGTGQFETCTGDLYALIYRPRTLKPNATSTDYNPNPFNVDVYLFNTNRFTQASNTYLTLTVGPHLKILDSNGVALPGNSQRVLVDPSTVDLGSVSTVTWHVLAEKNCAEDTSYLELYSSSSLGDPSFNEVCKLPVVLPCLDKDTLPPIAEPIVTNGFTKSMGFHDDRPSDKGLRSVQALGFNPLYFRVTVDSFAHCSKTTVPVSIHITQLDSTQGGCITVQATDCANNVTTEQICFPKYPLHPDTVKPRLILISSRGSFDSSFCNMKFDSLLAVDDTTYDLGLASISIADSASLRNFDLVTDSLVPGSARHGFAIRVRDTMVDGCITVRVKDRAGNYTDTTFCYCTIPDFNRPELQLVRTGTGSWSVYVQDIRPYDRGIDTIDVYNRNNITLKKNAVVFEPTRALTRHKSNFDFTIEVTDTTQFASFCIRAKDLADSTSLAPTAHWWTRDTCVNRDTVQDVWAPNIAIDPPPFLSPTTLNVTVNDIHYYNGTSVIGWDRGIDSIWFTNVHGMQVPPTIYRGCSTKDTTFQIVVTNSTSLDSIATVCVHAVDCAGNQTDTCWYYPVRPDDLPPQITSAGYTRSQIDLTVTDSSLYDRGLRHTILDSAVNFDAFERWDNGTRVVAAPISVTNPAQSATGVLRAIDLYGAHSTSTAEQDAHSANIHLAVWVQNIRFKVATIAQQSQDIRIPVLFLPTDTFPLVRKGLTKYQFSFDLIGDPGFQFVGVDTVGTASTHFNLTSSTDVNGRVTVTGTSFDGTPLMQQDSPLVYVIIHAQKDQSTRRTLLTPAVIGGNTVIYNDDAPVTATGQNSTAVMPAPFGIMGSGTIVAVGSCSPAVASNGATPSAVDLGPNNPNPFSGVTTLNFTVPADGMTNLIVYDALGREVARLIDESLPQGSYSVPFNPKGLTPGTYYARLTTNDKVVTRRMMFVK